MGPITSRSIRRLGSRSRSIRRMAQEALGSSIRMVRRSLPNEIHEVQDDKTYHEDFTTDFRRKRA